MILKKESAFSCMPRVSKFEKPLEAAERDYEAGEELFLWPGTEGLVSGV